MARINFVDGSDSVPGQKDARKDQKQKGGSASVPGQDDVGKDADYNIGGENSLFSTKSADEELYGPNYGRQKIRFHKADEVNPYADAEDARLGMDERARKIIIMVIVLVVVFLLAIILPTSIFDITVYPAGITPAIFLESLQTRISGLITFFTGGETFYTLFVWEQIAAVLAGAAMGLSGGVYQGALKNALASPSTLGVMSGGSVGMIFYALFAYNDFEGTVSEYNEMVDAMSPMEWVMEYFGSFIFSMVGCFIVVFIIMLIAYIAGRGHVSNISLVIAGQVLTSVLGVVVTCVEYYLIYVQGNETLYEVISSASTLTFTGTYTWWTVAIFAIPLIICMIIIFSMSGRLSLLAFDDAEARSMGISTTRTRNVMVAVCTIMTALVVSFVGAVGFIGFMIPHIARRFVGPEFRYLLPATALLGGIFVVATNYVANLGITGFTSGATGSFTSIIGCIFFLIMALRTRGDNRADWY